MFRFVSKRMPVSAAAAAAVPLVRFQSSAVVGESLVARPGANRRVFPSAQVLPRFEIHDVRDVAAQGSMTLPRGEQRLRADLRKDAGWLCIEGGGAPQLLAGEGGLERAV